jgi:hypothetical protein
MHVPSQALYEINVKSSQPFLLRDVLPGTAWTPFEAPARTRARNTDSPFDADAEDGNCLKGALVGLCLEGAMAISLYGIWQAWHLMR